MSRFTDQLKIEWDRTFQDIGNLILGRPPEFVFVGRHRVESCQLCPESIRKENPFSTTFPIIKCRRNMKLCYNPSIVQRWCPYADCK